MKKQILKSVTDAVCKFLNVDENLVFLKVNEIRLNEARKYICYLSIKQGVDAIFVSKYLGYKEARFSAKFFTSVTKHLQNYQNSQAGRDIEKLTQIIEFTHPV